MISFDMSNIDIKVQIFYKSQKIFNSFVPYYTCFKYIKALTNINWLHKLMCTINVVK